MRGLGQYPEHMGAGAEQLEQAAQQKIHDTIAALREQGAPLEMVSEGQQYVYAYLAIAADGQCADHGILGYIGAYCDEALGRGSVALVYSPATALPPPHLPQARSSFGSGPTGLQTSRSKSRS
jgi:hypothetical protein